MSIDSKWTFRRMALAAAGVAISLVAVVAVVVLFNRQIMPTLPVPDGAQNIHVSYDLLSFFKEVSFDTSAAYPAAEVIDFYDSWARKNGWQRIGRDRERWATDGWESFVDETQGKRVVVDQYLAHWASEDHRWSLRIALYHSRPAVECERGSQRVALWIERFDLIVNEDERNTRDVARYPPVG